MVPLRTFFTRWGGGCGFRGQGVCEAGDSLSQTDPQCLATLSITQRSPSRMTWAIEEKEHDPALDKQTNWKTTQGCLVGGAEPPTPAHLENLPFQSQLLNPWPRASAHQAHLDFFF